MTDEISQAVEWPPLGAALAAARNAKNLSVQAVSDTLRLSIKQISALESDDFSALPQPMATRGFIRNYARLLELDAEPLLDSYRQRVPDNTPTSLNVQTSVPHVQLVKKNRPWFKYAAIVLSLVLVVWYFQVDQSASIATDLTGNSEVVSPVALPELTTAPATLAEPASPPAAEVGTANSVATNLADTLPSPALTELAPAKAKPSPAAVASNDGLQLRPSSDMSMPTEAKANALGNRAWLTVSVTDKAWVQVKDKSGAVLFEKMLTANSSDKIEAQPPLFVWLGNAEATSLDYMGKSVDVASKTFNNTARLTLE
jgi:cytoskeleton protein RodZ